MTSTLAERFGADWRRSLRRSLCLSLLLSLSAAPASAQFWFPTQTDTYVVDDEYKRHTPEAGVISAWESCGFWCWRNVKTVSLFAVTDWGLSSRYWNSDTRSWSIWQPLGNPTGAQIQRLDQSGAKEGFDTNLRMLRGWSGTSRDWVGYFAFRKPGSPTTNPPAFTAMPELDAPSATLLWDETFPEDAAGSEIRTTGIPLSFKREHRDFDPEDGIWRFQGNQAVHHVFGTGLPLGYVRVDRFAGVDIPLIELRRSGYGNNEEWVVHGAPPGHSAVDMGSAGAVSVIHDYASSNESLNQEKHYVFVVTDPKEDPGYGDGINGLEVTESEGSGPTVFVRSSTNGLNWAWENLGAPPWAQRIYGPPAAAKYYTALPASGGKGRIVVYVAAQKQNGDWSLWQQYHDGGSWRGWTEKGPPPGIGGNKFKLTSSQVWYEGTPNTFGALRINFFGYSEKNGGINGKLVEWVWDGSWHFNASRSAPDGKTLRSTTSAVVDQGDKDRLLVFTRSSNGRIWEYHRERRNGAAWSENWIDLSWEPLFRLIP